MLFDLRTVVFVAFTDCTIAILLGSTLSMTLPIMTSEAYTAGAYDDRIE